MSDSPFKVRKNINANQRAEAPVASNNFAKEPLVGMTFNMPESWHREFKITAATHQMHMKDLLQECFDVWKQKHSQR